MKGGANSLQIVPETIFKEVKILKFFTTELGGN